MSDDDVVHAVRVLQRHGILDERVDVVRAMAYEIAKAAAAEAYRYEVTARLISDESDPTCAEHAASFAFTMSERINDLADERLARLSGE